MALLTLVNGSKDSGDDSLIEKLHESFTQIATKLDQRVAEETLAGSIARLEWKVADLETAIKQRPETTAKRPAQGYADALKALQ
ncbi:hypothetical protein JTB14_029113 [Gonioctena quinquepunctata]|nr:hypothetical protein JTB14_029113 [Gonioctena quinquepunctata]